MKTTSKKTALLVLVLMTMGTMLSAFNSVDKTTEKAREVIENAAPDDWESFAKAAKMCIRKEVNLTEAKSWLDKSLTIKESPQGHEAAGDYYFINKLYDKAINHYVQSMLLTKEADFYADTEDLQKKIEKAKAKS